MYKEKRAAITMSIVDRKSGQRFECAPRAFDYFHWRGVHVWKSHPAHKGGWSVANDASSGLQSPQCIGTDISYVTCPIGIKIILGAFPESRQFVFN